MFNGEYSIYTVHGCMSLEVVIDNMHDFPVIPGKLGMVGPKGQSGTGGAKGDKGDPGLSVLETCESISSVSMPSAALHDSMTVYI